MESGLQTWRERFLTAIRLLPTAAVAVGFLGASGIEASSAPASILDKILFLTSVVVILSLSGVFLSGSPARWMMGLAAGAGLVLSVPVALAGVVSLLGHGLRFEPVIWTVLATLGSLSLLTFALSRLRQRAGTASGFRAIAAAVLAPTVLLSGLGLWHQAAYLPAQLEATIAVDISLRFARSPEPPTNRGTAKVSVTNQGDVGTFIIISKFSVCPRENHTKLKGVDKGCEAGIPPIGRQSYVESKGALTHQQVFTWEEDSTVVESEARLAYARSDRLRLGMKIDDLSTCTLSTGAKDSEGISEAYPILPGSQYQSLVNPEYILAYGPGSNGDTYWVTTADDPSCDRDLALLVEFGIREIGPVSQEWILSTDVTPPD